MPAMSAATISSAATARGLVDTVRVSFRSDLDGVRGHGVHRHLVARLDVVRRAEGRYQRQRRQRRGDWPEPRRQKLGCGRLDKALANARLQAHEGEVVGLVTKLPRVAAKPLQEVVVTHGLLRTNRSIAL